MLKKGSELVAGVFDSSILRGGQEKSPLRQVECYELELFHTQAGTSHVDGKDYPTCRGMLLCARPGQLRYSHFPVRCSYIRVYVPKEGREDLHKALCSLPLCTYIHDQSQVDLLMGLFAKLSALCVSSEDSIYDQVHTNQVFWDILCRCMRICFQEELARSAPPANRAIQNACEYIREHYAYDTCTLESVAHAVGLSRTRLHVLFRQITGKTPYAYMTDLRIEQAKVLIAAGEKTMAQIALDTGFCSQSHFTKAFRTVTGVTPSAFRSKLTEQYW